MSVFKVILLIKSIWITFLFYILYNQNLNFDYLMVSLHTLKKGPILLKKYSVISLFSFGICISFMSISLKNMSIFIYHTKKDHKFNRILFYGYFIGRFANNCNLIDF